MTTLGRLFVSAEHLLFKSDNDSSTGENIRTIADTLCRTRHDFLAAMVSNTSVSRMAFGESDLALTALIIACRARLGICLAVYTWANESGS